MHTSAVALVLSAALANAEFLSPNRGQNLAVNEAFSIEWETDGLVEPLSINLVPAGPGDFVVAQQVGLDIQNSGELEFIPDATISNFDAFQFVLTDSEGNSFDSEPFQIDGLTEDPIEATVTLEDVETVLATQDGAEFTELVTSSREAVASVPASPIRLAVSAGETVNQVLETDAPVVQQLNSNRGGGGGGGASAQSQDETEAEVEDDGFRVAGGVAEEDAEQFAPAAIQGVGEGNGDFGAQFVAINPGNPNFQEATFAGSDIGPLNLGPANPAGGGAGVLTAEVLPTAEVAQTGIDGALSFNPVATPAATALVNTLVGSDPAAVTVGALDAGATAVEGALTLAPIDGGLTPLGGAAASAGVASGGFSPLNAAASANIAGVDSVDIASATAAGVGGIGATNGALTVEPLSTGVANVFETGVQLNTDIPLGGGNTLAPTLGAGASVGAGNGAGPLVPDVTDIVGGTPANGGTGLIAPTNTGLLPNNGGAAGGSVTLQTSILGGTGLAPQATTSQVTVGAGSVGRPSFILAGVVALFATVML